MKKKLLLLILFVSFSLLGVAVFGNSASALKHPLCPNANGHLYINSPNLGLDISELGGSTGVGWACGDDRWGTNSAIVFFASSVSVNDGVYTVNSDVQLGTGEYTTVRLYGMVHYHGSGTSTQYASHIGFCVKEGDCRGTGLQGEDSVNTDAEGGTADGIIKDDYSGILQRAGSANPHPKDTNYWALPAYYNEIQIHNATLRSKIANYSTSGLTISDSLKNGGNSGWVKLYIHRCFSTSKYGTVKEPSTCEEGAVYLYVYNVVDKTTFDGSVSAALGTCTSDCWIDSGSSTVTFTHQMKRNNDGGSGNINNSFWTYYDKSASDVSESTSSSDSGSQDFAKNSGWKTVKTHDVSVSLDPGGSTTKCEALGFYNTVTGSSSKSGFTTKSACLKVSRYADYNFSGSVSGYVNGVTKAADNKYYIDTDKATVTFNYQVCRTDSGGENSATTQWQAWYDKAKSDVTSATNPASSASGSVALKKSGVNGQCSTNLHSHSREIKDITPGDHTTRDTIGWYKAVYHNGGMHTWDKADGYVTIHRYYWYNLTGSVSVAVSGAKKEASTGYWWTETNYANLKFTHSMKSDTAGKKTKYKTSKNPTISNTFNTQANYTETSSLTNANQFYDIYYSPSTGSDALVDKGDNGQDFCQTLTYYSKVREDLNWNNTATFGGETSTSGCVKVIRRKTTFTGSSKVYVKVNGTSTDYTNGSYAASGTTYPVIVPVTFSHTVTRSTTDAHGSENTKNSHIKTTLKNHATNKVRTGDPEGDVIDVDTTSLAAGGSDTKSNTFNVKIYPEQTITLCQQMNYWSEIRGTEVTGTANADEVCVTITLAKATCLGQEFGIKNAKNYLRASIYKNNADTANQTSGVKYEGDSSITAWAKPSDQIRFQYEGCAGGEIARQYAFSNTKTVYNATGYSHKYPVIPNKEKIDQEGYLFGRSMNSSPYTDLSRNFSNASENPGTGPFTNNSYEVNIFSPDGDTSAADRLYSCDFYLGTPINNFYRIPAYIENLSPDNYRSSCRSDDYGRVNDLGTTIIQKVTWTDTQYSGGSPVNGHNGANASVTAQVRVPYNYSTTVTNSGHGGYIIPGTNHTEHIKVTVDRRKNSVVNGASDYATVTKPMKYRLIEIVIGTDRTDTAASFNDKVNKEEYFSDSDGRKNLASSLDVCKSFNCTIVASNGDETENRVQLDPSKNTADGQTVASFTRYIPQDIEPGVKYCYISAVWPSDSHIPVWNSTTKKYELIADPTAQQNIDYALTTNGSFWHVSGATCFTTAKRPSFAVLGGDTYAQGYISARVQKYPDNNGNNPRIYGSWAEYAAISGNSLKGFASGATLWGGSNIVADTTDATQSCSFSAYTFANAECKEDKLGKLQIDTTTSSNPETIAEQIITRYTRTDGTGALDPKNSNPLPVKDGGVCRYDNSKNTYLPYNREDGATFECIGDTGAKYTHVRNQNGPVAYIPNDVNYCMVKGDTNNSRTSIIHADGTIIIGTNIAYGDITPRYNGQPVSPAGLCYEDYYNSISEIPQSIIIAKKIIIKGYVQHVDSWLIADEIITCDPSDSWRGDVPISDINTHNCDQQLTINGPVMTKNLKLYRTYGNGYVYDRYYDWRGRYHSDIVGNAKASPAEIFTMGPEVYLWSFNQAQRYSQATTTYARELAPRY